MAKKRAAVPDTRKAVEPRDPMSAGLWHDELKAAEKREETWIKRADKVVARYRDERDMDDRGERRTNILWSNTEILKSVLFQSIGNPDVRRRFPKKGKDERASRQAAMSLERALSYCGDSYDSDAEIEYVVEDHLIAGRGQAWIVYDADVAEEETEDDDGNKVKEAVEITDQSVRFEHVFWKDYRTSAGRKESDIWWKARRHHYNRDELIKYFGEEHGKAISLNVEMSDGAKGKDRDETFKRACVWEIWDKTKKERLYVADGYPKILKKDDDPYELRQFFPCPAAMYGVKTTSSLQPIPEYTLYQDQCEELDAITTRLNRLIDALKRRGVYDASAEGPDNQLSNLATAGDNQFIPYKGFAVLMEKGGLSGVFQTEDLRPIIEVVQQLYQQRATLIQTIYEVTGISDVVRGASNPNETATAQRIKGQFGSLRITTRQAKVNRFIRDLYRLKGEIIAEHFTREKLVEMTGLDMPLQMEIDQAKQQLAMIEQAKQQAQQPPQPGQPPAPAMPQVDPAMVKELQVIAKAVPWEEISGILRSDDRRGYKVDIETEDTAQVDEDAEKAARMEFLTTMQNFMTAMVPAAQAQPESIPLVKELAVFAVKSFKVGRGLEEAFDDFFNKLEQAPPQPPQPNPDVMKAEAEIKRADADMQMKQATHQEDLKHKELDRSIKEYDLQLKSVEIEGKTRELDLKAQQLELGIAADQQDMAHQAATHEMNAEKHAVTIEGAHQTQAQKAEAAEAKSMQAQGQTRPSAPVRRPLPQIQPRQQQTGNNDILVQAITQMALGLDELRRSNALVVKAVTAPRTTKLLRDASGRSVGAVQTVMNFDNQPAFAS